MLILTNLEGGVGIPAARTILTHGGSALDAVEQGIRTVEADETIDSVGSSGYPNLLGKVECDAAIMDGETRQSGAVGALQGYRHPIAIARKLMETLPHVFLVGNGAARFAEELKAERSAPSPGPIQDQYQRWVKTVIPDSVALESEHEPLTPYIWKTADLWKSRDTTIFLVQDREGKLAGGASTSGWPYKYPGRLGDSPVIGAGLYVDNRYGGCACTFTGEMTIRAGTARSVVLYLKYGATIEEACHEAVQDLQQLRGGYLGPVVIHALARDGSVCVVTTHDLARRVDYWLWSEADLEPNRLWPIIG